MRARHLLWLLFFVGALAVQLSCSGANEPGGTNFIHSVEDPDREKEIAWAPGMTLEDILLRRSAGEWRLVVHIWRPKERLKLSIEQLRNAQTVILRPDDVLVFGLVDDERRKRVERLPQVAKALGLVIPQRPLPSSGANVPPAAPSPSSEVLEAENSSAGRLQSGTPSIGSTRAPSVKQQLARNVSIWPWAVAVIAVAAALVIWIRCQPK